MHLFRHARRRGFTDPGTSLLATGLAFTVLASFALSQGAEAASAARPSRAAQRIWQPSNLPKNKTVPVTGTNAAKATLTAAQQKAHAAADTQQYQPSAPVWPSVSATDVSVKAGTSVSVIAATRAQADAAGVSGAVYQLSNPGGAPASGVRVTISYAKYAAAYGGGWADRLRVVALPTCALTTPQVAACQLRTPVAFTQDGKAQTLTAAVDVPGAWQGAAHAAANSTGASDATVLAVTSSSSGSVGTYTATSLSPQGTWSAGNNSGDFTYSYPITVPVSATGAGAPDVTLAYDSGSVDARTSAVNAQASWIGDGWDYAPGFVERSYEPCSQDDKKTNWYDLCWAGNQVTLSLGGHSEQLVESGGTWKQMDDDGTQVIALSGANDGVTNGTYNNEAWKVVTPDGTEYFFGLNHLPGTASTGAATQSAWTEPVYCPESTDPCNASSSGANSFAANMAWRWNLDYVVDPHGNLQTYNWVPETNYYDRGYTQGNGTGTNTFYDRGGYLSSISYGYRLPDAVAGAKPADVINFGVSERCVISTTLCQASNLSSSTASYWPDVPFDQICASATASCSSDLAPSFFSTKRLTSISTQVLVGSAYQPVDTYTLTQMFPSPQAGVISTTVDKDAGDGTVAVMWLNSIQRTGNDTLGGGSAVSTPAVTFTGMQMANRVAGTTTGYAALFRPRMDYIDTETGAQIVVSYNTNAECSSVPAVSTADSNTADCFPMYWTPSGATAPILDWFEKPQVSAVTVNDLVTPAAWSEAQVTSYSYSGIAWHRDDSPLTAAAQRTWNQFRGYRTVTATAGSASDLSVPTQTVTTYLQGMDGDRLSTGATRTVSVSDTVGDSVTDSNWLAGQELETDTLLGAGGAVEKKTVSGPWAYTVTGTENQADSMPALTSRMQASGQARTFALTHTGTWATTATVTDYDSSARVVTADAKGDGTAAVPEVCTTTSYASSTSGTSNMLDFPDEVKAVRGPCGTAATAANTVSDTLTYYDSSTTLGALPGPGDVTRTRAVDSYNGAGAPVYVTESQKTYDTYGRAISSTDADNNTTKTAYAAVAASPDTVTATNPMGWASTLTLDPARDVAISSADVNNELTTETYDGLGRLTAVWTPLRSASGGQSPNKKFAYAVNGTTAPTTVSTSTLREDGSYGTDIKIYDADEKVIQDQAPTADGSNGRLLTDTHYNSLGQTVKTTSAYSDANNAPSTTLFVASEATIPSETETRFDGLARTTAASTVAYATTQWTTTTAYPGVDQTDVTAVAGGTSTSTFTDVLGRKTATWSYGTAAPTDKATDAEVTSYTYTPLGKTATIADNAGNTWKYSYDLHGNQTQLVDPGAGTSTTTFSTGGRVLSTTDGAGSTLTYTYDALGRKTAEYNTTNSVGPSASNELVSWTYDALANGTAAKGKLASSSRYTDGASDATQTYTEQILGYTALYQPTDETVTIPSAEGALAGTYESTNSYTGVTSLLSGTHYYAEGGLPKEQVNFSYTLSGLLSAFGGTYTYMNTATYTPQGQSLNTNYGVYGSQLVRSNTYDATTQRMLTATDSLQPLSSALDATTYTYDNAGKITSESDAQNGVATADEQCFGYDGQGRLTSAWTSTDAVNSSSTSSTAQVQGTGGCADTSPTAGKISGGPAAYAQTYSYDALGDRVSQTQLDPTTAAATTTQTLSYPGSGTTVASQPAAVQSVATTNGSGTNTVSYTYDSGGNTVARTGQSFTYDAENHTASVTNTATKTTSTYTYAPDGSLLVERDPATSQNIVYLPWGEEIHLNRGTSAVSGLRYYKTSPDGVTIVRSSSGDAQYELTDTLNTATTAVDVPTLAVTRRYLDPYGDVRGSAPANWPDQHGYLNKPVDAATGLSLLGARQYDPVTGRFLSVDPLLESGDQRQMNGYSYAADNPVNTSDPTGLISCVDRCDGPGSRPVRIDGPIYGPFPPKDPSYNEAYNEYFGAQKPGWSRVVLHTGYRSPGHGIVIARFFIPGHSAALGMLLGDDRDFSLDPKAPYRMVVAWDTDTGEVSFTVAPSTVTPGFMDPQQYPFNPVPSGDSSPRVIPARLIGPGQDNAFKVGPSLNGDGLNVSVRGLNSLLPRFSILGDVDISFNAGHARVLEFGTAYPDFEAIQYPVYGAPRNLGQAAIGPLGDLAAVPDLPDGRYTAWVDGNEQSNIAMLPDADPAFGYGGP